jgi:hypothetical protein
MGASETIIINPVKVLLPGSTFATEKNLVALSLSYTLTGGSFSINTLLDAQLGVPPENAILSLPFGRVGVVKNVGRSQSSGGLIANISGPIQPFAAQQQTYYGMFVLGVDFKFTSQLALLLGAPVTWDTLDVRVRSFIYRGIALGGIQQLAQLLLADVLIRADGIHVTDPGQVIGPTFSVPKSDIVTVQQATDYTLDIPSILNPAISQVQGPGNYIYDEQHAQKQPKFTVQAGAPGAQGSSDFIPIPDGWFVDGEFEEWTPASATDLTNPSASVGRYWKVFPSPTSPGMMRGITAFRSIVKELRIAKGIAPFIASPITSYTRRGVDTEFDFEFPGIESNLQGFQSSPKSFFDVISNQFITFQNCLSLVPTNAVLSGDADKNFYSITMEQWTFPNVGQIHFPNGPFDPTNPFNIPKNVQVINPSTNTVFFSVPDLEQYWNKYVINFQLINSPRLRTTLTCIFRNNLPQVGDGLFIQDGVATNNCGRISSVTLNYSRGGLVLNIVAERYQFS